MSISGSTATATAHAAVAQWRARLAGVDGGGLTDAGRIDLIEELERLKAAAAAAQARVTAAFAESQTCAVRAGLPEGANAAARRRAGAQASRSVAAQVALARHDSPARGQRHLGLARALVAEMPHTMSALTRGDVSERRATIVARETACLSREDRTRTDAEIASRLGRLGDKRLGDTVRGIAQRLDPASCVRRMRKAVGERRISLRPAPDTMSYMTGLLPVAQGVAVYAALKREADSLRGQGDVRTAAQLMADVLVERVTGASSQRASAIEIQLVMTDRTLLQGDPEPGYLAGFGPVPATLARRLARDADKAWVRRLFTRPGAGDLVALDSHRPTFVGRLRDLLVLRDQTCRNPWCDAPVRQVDHVTSWRRGGRTTRDNGQGLCEACNYVKETPGWRADVIYLAGGPHTVETTTPTGHHYQSTAPPQPGTRSPSYLDIVLDYLVQDTA